MKDKIIERLMQIGYLKAGDDTPPALTPVDEMMIDFVAEKITRQIEADLNDSIPEELTLSVVDMIIGEFLMSKKNLGQLAIDDIDVTDAVKSISEGDTSITFADGMSQSEKLDAFINYLKTPKVSFTDFRRIRW